MIEELRFDFNGSPDSFRRTPQGFLRVNARLTKAGIFTYDNRREYRSDEEVFRADSLSSVVGAPVTDLHPSEKGADLFLTPANARSHVVGMTEKVERDGDYLKGSLIIFDEKVIKAIESGERKEISLGYKCHIDPTPGTINGEAYDARQKNIVVNHVAIGPKGWGRAGADCAIRTDSQTKGKTMTDTVRLDGADIALTAESVQTFFNKSRKELLELKGRLDAMKIDLEKEKTARTALEDPKAIEAKVSARLSLIEQCKAVLGEDFRFDSKSDQELKLEAIKKHYPEINLGDKTPEYLDGIFYAITEMEKPHNDSLNIARISVSETRSAQSSYEKWLQQSADMWQKPLTGALGGF